MVAERVARPCALGNLATQTAELLRVLQKFDDFLKLFTGFINAGNIFKSDLAMLFGQQLCLGLTKAHRAACTAALLHLAQHEKCDAQD